MYVDLYWVKEKFAILNKALFNSELPTPAFVVNNSYDYLGLCSYRRRRITKKNPNPVRYIICISNYYSRNEGDFLNTLLHEMIHLYFYSIGKLDVDHGMEFQKMGRSFDKYGFNIATCNDAITDIRPLIGMSESNGNNVMNWLIRLLLSVVAWAFIRNNDAVLYALYMLEDACNQTGIQEVILNL